MITSTYPRSVASIKRELAGTIDRVFTALQELQGNLQRVAVSTTLIHATEVQGEVTAANTVAAVDGTASSAKRQWSVGSKASQCNDISVDDERRVRHPRSNKSASMSRGEYGSWSLVSDAETNLSSFVMIASNVSNIVHHSVEADQELDGLVPVNELPIGLLEEVGSWTHQSLLLVPLNQAKTRQVHSQTLNQEDFFLEEIMRSAVTRNEHRFVALKLFVDVLERGICAESCGDQFLTPAGGYNYPATNNPPWTPSHALQA